MLKIDVIKFETQDVITTSIPKIDPVPADICYCNDSCSYADDGKLSHSHDEECTKCTVAAGLEE